MKRIATTITSAVLALGLSQALAETASYEIVDHGIAASLTGAAGNAEEGAKTFINRKLGNCLACHSVSVFAKEPFHGNVGPGLDGVASRYSEAELRLIVVNSKEMFEGTIMPAFHKDSGFTRVAEKFEGKPILTAEQVEDVVAFLSTLK